MSTQTWVTAIEVARHFGTAKETVYRWHDRKGLPAHKIS